MALTSFKITLSPGASQVEIDGRNVSDQVTGLQLQARLDDMPRLLVEMIPEGTIDGEGLVHVFHASADWLDMLDPEQLEREVTAGMDAFDGESYTQALLRRLKEIARHAAA